VGGQSWQCGQVLFPHLGPANYNVMALSVTMQNPEAHPIDYAIGEKENSQSLTVLLCQTSIEFDYFFVM
jgi:hypothetical protein